MEEGRGNKRLACAYVKLKSGEIIYAENSVYYIKEQMNSEESKIWIDLAAIVKEKVIPIDKADIATYGTVIH